MNSLLFTIDIDSLYTNVETKTRLEAVKKWFFKYPNVKRPDKNILELLEINLTKKNFEFNSEFYLQTKGTAMGKKITLSYANIYMANWEESAWVSAALKPLDYFRFLDDIWGVWNNSKQEFIDFTQHLNSHHSSIKIK